MPAEAYEKLVLGLLALCSGQFALLLRMWKASRSALTNHVAPTAPEVQFLAKLLNGMRPPPTWLKDMQNIAKDQSRATMDEHEDGISDKIEKMRKMSDSLSQLQIQVAQLVDDMKDSEIKCAGMDSRVRDMEKNLTDSLERFTSLAAKFSSLASDIPRATVELLIARSQRVQL